MKPAARRISKYQRMYLEQPSALPPKCATEQARGDMLAAFTTAAHAYEAMELEVKQVLDAVGVSASSYAPYLAFARQLQRMRDNQMTGESAAIEAELRIVQWVARGLSRSTLELIRTQVFNIQPPSVP